MQFEEQFRDPTKTFKANLKNFKLKCHHLPNDMIVSYYSFFNKVHYWKCKEVNYLALKETDFELVEEIQENVA